MKSDGIMSEALVTTEHANVNNSPNNKIALRGRTLSETV
jgi:hypothetical protein